ncbi:hypothetical protein CH330_01390 [candidate division WOR-3 bacterium JGI_Cruoil_03_51_56]|uniref:Uncharacterized protein n=1 Tax=candidate division WOR-3 bacterium JGI_Cruoil_03_51_56 TaxID=1973747 RepID=A0A235BX86_UNCW3|nr:MAG: hypothetical protein CH330_01390 [candidate division WOR-3 bacterium JGI_Cruoil_03_51_56]
MTYEFNPGWPDSFLDTIRIEGKDKVKFDGFVDGVKDGEEIPAYMFGVQSIWHMKIMSAEKDRIANCTVNNPGQFGNTVTIHIYAIGEDGTIGQLSGYEETKIEFNGEGN